MEIAGRQFLDIRISRHSWLPYFRGTIIRNPYLSSFLVYPWDPFTSSRRYRPNGRIDYPSEKGQQKTVTSVATKANN